MARSWTASQIRVEMSKSVSLDAATSSPRITCKKHTILDWERNSENFKVEKNTNQVWMRLKGALQGNMWCLPAHESDEIIILEKRKIQQFSVYFRWENVITIKQAGCRQTNIHASTKEDRTENKITSSLGRENYVKGVYYLFSRKSISAHIADELGIDLNTGQKHKIQLTFATNLYKCITQINFTKSKQEDMVIPYAPIEPHVLRHFQRKT